VISSTYIDISDQTGAYAPAWSLMSMYVLLITIVGLRARGLLGRKSALET